MDRRDFLAVGAATLATTTLGLPNIVRAQTPQKILILGGTNFVGPAVVSEALKRGHEVTLFNRGITRPHLFPSVEKLQGDRKPEGGDLTALMTDRRWDAVIDTWPEHSAVVEATARLLQGRTNYYFFCSSIAVYRDFSKPGLSETAPTYVDDPGWYGGEKAVAEQLLADLYPDAFGVSRCHAIFGPNDDGNAFHYWLRRLATSEEVLAPGTGKDPVQYIDVRDLAIWILDSTETKRTGIYNTCGAGQPIIFKDFLEGARKAIGSSAKLTWVDADFLRSEQEVRSFSDMPLWAPLDEDEGFYQISGAKALKAGANYRPFAETARAAWRWHSSYPFRHTSFPLGGLGLSREKEEAVLNAWHNRS
ncbi:MAG: NAD-dependent epimerase/dehydratase family protein [Kordiimonadaceae bacterium]|nr:NAD-dependent epimerase/dehydratase family protein [Kordiimonadaceae bacterium]MBO6567333.1 NAD-dependent epimerase/dehydratase family protein [Kordiimonadaceae bacterium]